eukprot:7022500-Pyramimonas_sp.AAC.1
MQNAWCNKYGLQRMGFSLRCASNELQDIWCNVLAHCDAMYGVQDMYAMQAVRCNRSGSKH